MTGSPLRGVGRDRRMAEVLSPLPVRFKTGDTTRWTVMDRGKDIQTQLLLGTGPARPACGPVSRELAAEMKGLWLKGEPADALTVLSRYPKFKSDKDLLLDLAYEEYLLRRQTPQPPDPEEFCARFPALKGPLRRRIDAARQLAPTTVLPAELPPERWPEAQDSFLGFTLLRELGRGAFARVYLATEPALGHRRVAVKVSRQGGPEARTLGRISHPNIVPVHSVQEEPSTGL